MEFVDVDDVSSQYGTVGKLEEYLFNIFPKQHCEPWDKCGLTVGDSTDVVEGVAIALDPHEVTIERAAEAGCNVLLTHHPVFLDPPERIVDRSHGGTDSAARVLAAIGNGVSLISMHTNLDRSPLALESIIDTVGLTYTGGFVSEDDGLPPFGCTGVLPEGVSPTLEWLAQRCADAFETFPRVWGDSHRTLRSIGMLNGSSSSLASAIVNSNVDCVITGEMSYHKACEVAAAGKCIICLGHDVSERPLLDALAKAVGEHAVFGRKVCVLEPDLFWWQPGMVR